MRKLAVLVLSLLVPVVAFAQANQEAAAKEHFTVATQAYNGGDYSKAVQEFLTAYQLAPSKNALLFNIGQAYRMSGDKEKALAYYEKYVEFEPGGGQVGEAKQYIGELKEAVETQRRQRQAEDEERARQQAEADAKAKAAADAKARTDRDRQRAEADSAGSGLRIGGLVLGGVGVVALGAGIAIAAGGSTGAGLGVGGAGVAAIAGGTAMYLIGKKQQNDAKAKVGVASAWVPVVGSGYLGGALVGSF